MQNTERRFRNERSAVFAHTADRFGNPRGIAREQFVIFADTHEFHDTQFHYEMIDIFLRLRFRNQPLFQIAFDINIEERAVSADRHCRAVLIFHRREIAEIQCLHCFFRRFCRLRNITTVNSRHLFQLFQRFDLFRDFLSVAYEFGGHFAVHRLFIRFLFRDQIIHAVQRHSAIIAYDSASAVRIGKPRKNMRFSRRAHFGRVCVVNAVVMRFSVLRENLLHLRIEMIAVHFQRFFRHTDSAERL